MKAPNFSTIPFDPNPFENTHEEEVQTWVSVENIPVKSKYFETQKVQ